ncbi:unnamed protein product [Miscanthus lutarioriparius]|uniref:Uncharacterized protein n=1 Tax=Miscanthus lutarioriparius TaxID=422564 RepID=A0A811MJG2_9POAL|nr:unnamed protein product [Miscanthus lutarioriparius]
MERRVQQPGDAQQPGKDGGGDSPPPQPELRQGPAVRVRDDGPLRAARHQPQARTRAPPALHVEAVRDGEEPVSFGPSAALVDY